MPDSDRFAEARAMIKAGRSDDEIQASLEITPLQLLELRAEHAAAGTTLRWIIPNIRAAAPQKKKSFLKWLSGA
jgi:hypothetical protein